MTLFIIDASHYQTGLPISGLKAAGFPALILKATEGTSFTDPTFAAGLAAGRKAGLLMAAYHFLSGSADLGAQAANTAAAVPPDIPVWVDVEGGSTRDQAYVYADALRARGRKVAGIYHGAQPRAGYGGWWRAGYLADPAGPAAAVYASQGGAAAEPWKAGTLRHPDLWQFCQHGRVPGFSGDVDFSAYRGTLAQLAATGWFWVPPGLATVPAVVPTPEPEPPKEIEMRIVQVSGGRTFVVNGPVSSAVPADLLPAWLKLAGQTAPDVVPSGLVAGTVDIRTFALIQQLAATAAGKNVDVDEVALAGQLAPLLAAALPAHIQGLSDTDLAAVATAVADENARRQAA